MPYVISCTSAFLWLSPFTKFQLPGCFAIFSKNLVLALTLKSCSGVVNRWWHQDTNPGNNNLESVGWEFDPHLPWDKCSPLFWTPGVFHHSCCHTDLWRFVEEGKPPLNLPGLNVTAFSQECQHSRLSQEAEERTPQAIKGEHKSRKVYEAKEWKFPQEGGAIGQDLSSSVRDQLSPY
jgi:hypothetical protein